MDLSQNKPTRSEWQNLEIPVSDEEKGILKMLMAGFHQPDIHTNRHTSIATFMKIAPQEVAMDTYIYTQFFQETIQGFMTASFPVAMPILPSMKKIKIKKSDMIRIEQLKKTILANNASLQYEFVLLQFLQSAIHSFVVLRNRDYCRHVYTLIRLKATATVPHVNTLVYDFVYQCVDYLKQFTTVTDILYHAVQVVEQNTTLIQYADLSLYSHQKDLFRLFSQPYEHPRLVLYIAPTGTGKTLSPLALAQNDQCVIFLCSARHVGLGLAKAAISMQKRVAFAYGCETAEDIRLHNFAAVDYTVHKKSGAIFRVDNSNGSRVEIMICDMKSYIIAMKFMLEFHPLESLILYWDEPTITMDYESHPLHDMIHRNWHENLIPNIVLSCATLPKSGEIEQTLDNFRGHFENAKVVSIVSHDCRKSISVLDADSKVALPHLLFYNDGISLQRSVEHCQENKTMLRYLDLAEIVRFLELALTEQELLPYFVSDIALITMRTIKQCYLKIIGECVDMTDSKWSGLLIYLKETQKPRYKAVAPTLHKIHSVGPDLQMATAGGPLRKLNSVLPIPIVAPNPNPFSGILFTTEDAQTLTDGPTIYLAENVETLGLFYIKQTQFPSVEMKQLLHKIQSNHAVELAMQQFENQMEDQLGKETLKEKKMAKEHFSKEVKILKSQIELQRTKLESLSIRSVLVPNTEDHLIKWAGLDAAHTLKQTLYGKPFTSRIEEADVLRIMKSNINDTKKILLLLGVGIFSQQTDAAYLEIIKELANEQKLYLILASSDYIYGTNYQFCHGILGKDLMGMTQQKMIQAMGRVGRNNIQQDYTVRFRHSELLKTLFLPMERNLEAINMTRLFMK